ncbi:MADF domain-containing protein [Caenorhabditis elegans]|uniref:MADF domain-containing protein n=1 Tax=Caenorhabditis elegans TaxID=6239 RepID=Q9XV35_CAEEL|nr:MADF domain-containing protein [Caenorhabditis elegans]CAB04312.1 MADF domain-containing protein [Caenorhabditis elegans]|eukprot:NP_492896.1 MADF domain transcription factor [Caenorhabditis elegans]
MAQWTDPSRQCLINAIRNRPVIWDKNYFGESNYRTLKTSCLREVTSELNSMFQMPIKFTCEDVRSQWKNLKDTFVRKLRWVHEGKYMEDAMKEPTWKFYRMLTFLDEKEAKRLGDTCEHTYELAPNSTSCGQRAQISYEPTSTEEKMFQMFNNQPPPQLSQQSMIDSSQIATCSNEPKMTSSSTFVTSSTSLKRGVHYSPTRSPNGSSSGLEEELEDEDEQPGRKKSCRRQVSNIQPMQVITTPPVAHQDEFDHFGAMVAANLRRIANEQGRMNALRVQRRLYDALFLDE